MKIKLIIAAIAFFGIVCPAKAQETQPPQYQRSSLHMVLLTTDEPGLDGAEDFSAQLDKAWQSYPFPDKYNKHLIDFTQAYGGTPKGSLLEIINMYKDGFQGMSIIEAKELLDKLQKPTEYNNNLVATINDIVSQEKLGNDLLVKWFNIQEDGSWDYQLISERASYDASQADIAEAMSTARGVQAIIDKGEDLISNTFVTFSKSSFYPSEPIAAFIRDLTIFIADQTPAPANAIMKTAAATAYAATCKGYTARTTTALYKLDWTEEVKAEFYSMFNAEGKVDMEKFNAYTFPMSLVGIDNSNNTTIDTKSGLASVIGIDEAVKPDDQLIQQTVIRNIDKLFAKLQKSYEVFAPVSQIISVDPLMADMGMKEGLEGGESFNLLEPVLNLETNEIEWKSIGIVKVSKKEIWDNRYSLVEGAPAEESEGPKGTVLSGNKKAAVGMVVKQVVKSKK